MRCLGVLELVSEPRAARSKDPQLLGRIPAPRVEPIEEPDGLEEEELPVPARKYRGRSEGARGGGGASAREDVGDIFPEHPLFPFSDDDEEGFDVSFIQITRWEGGKQVWGPTLPAAELQSELAIQEQFGGGVYVLLAKRPLRSDRSKPGSVTKSRKVSLPGRSKPLSSDPTPEEIAAFDPSTRAVVTPGGANAGAFTGGGGFEQVLLAMMSMQQQTAERAAAENRESARRESENSKAFMTMFLGMMNSSKSDSASMVQMMMTLSAQQQQSMVSLLPALIGARGGGPEEMAKFAELFKTLGFAQPGKAGAATPKDDDNSIGAILSNGADILQGFLALKGTALNGASPMGADAPPALAQPGSAAEMLERMRRGQ